MSKKLELIQTLRHATRDLLPNAIISARSWQRGMEIKYASQGTKPVSDMHWIIKSPIAASACGTTHRDNNVVPREKKPGFVHIGSHPSFQQVASHA